jgi:transmembrane sensor
MSVGESGTDQNEIDLEALRWVLLREQGPLSARQESQLAAWVAADIRHQGALIRARAASLHLDRLAALAGGRSILAPIPRRYVTRRGLIAATVSATGLASIGAWLSYGWMEEVWGGTRYVSDIGQMKKITLADGSVMTMNTQTELRVRYTRERRNIHFVHGETLFSVAHDAARPFAVRVGEWTVLAVGTAFVIRRLDAATMDITVTEGIVDMLPPASGPVRASQRLTANHGAVVDANGRIEVWQAPASEIARQLAWRAGMLVFAGEPLRQVLAEMNRYTSRQIRVADPQLAERRIVGVFPTTDTQTFVSAMEATLGVEAVANGHVVLLRRVN